LAIEVAPDVSPEDLRDCDTLVEADCTDWTDGCSECCESVREREDGERNRIDIERRGGLISGAGLASDGERKRRIAFMVGWVGR
jgi:hypothetical protein